MALSRLAYLRLAIGCVVPHTVVEVVRTQRDRRRWRMEKQRIAKIRERLSQRERPAAFPYSWSDAVDFLAALDCDREAVVMRTMPEASLNFCTQELARRVTSGPILGLHIGNFLGVSLCHFTDFARRLDQRSSIVSIDPNLAPGGMTNPLEKVIRCLLRYNLQDHSLVLTGYSLEKRSTRRPDTAETFDREFSCEQQLTQLVRWMSGRFDFAVIDGNHDGDYVAREIGLIDQVLKPGGIFVFDDVQSNAIGELYRGLDPQKHEHIGSDGRVGLALKR